MVDLELIIIPLRAFQALFTLVVMGSTAYVSNWWLNYWRVALPPPQFTLLLFASGWTILTLLFLVLAPIMMPRVSNNSLVMLGAEGLNMGVWLAGWVSLTVFLSARVCFGNVCNMAKASVAFAAAEWLLFGITMLLTGLIALRNRQNPATSSPKAKMVEDAASSSNPSVNF